jgi:carbamoyl-phosphate synthase large subunit
MARIQLGGAGGAPTNNFIKSLRVSKRKDYLIGMSCIPTDLFLADVDEKYIVPLAKAADYPQKLLALLKKSRPELLHVQHDYEVRAVSRLREQITALGVKLYLPDANTIENCVDKQKSAAIWQRAGICIPKTLLLNNENDLRLAFDRWGEVWIRAIEGAGGNGALPTSNFVFAKNWINYFQGWGKFTAAEMLTDKSVTWQSIWYQGELILAQTRRRRSWNFADRTLSGVTGVTGVGETCSDITVDRVAQDAIFAIDAKPHGVFSVDMTYDKSGLPNPTEINIGRFFTTHYFFTKAGINFPEIFCNIVLDGKFPIFNKKINPLPDGLLWIRGMDTEPVLISVEELEKFESAMRNFYHESAE